jgi:hypothetical protein
MALQSVAYLCLSLPSFPAFPLSETQSGQTWTRQGK